MKSEDKRKALESLLTGTGYIDTIMQAMDVLRATDELINEVYAEEFRRAFLPSRVFMSSASGAHLLTGVKTVGFTDLQSFLDAVEIVTNELSMSEKDRRKRELMEELRKLEEG